MYNNQCYDCPKKEDNSNSGNCDGTTDFTCIVKWYKDKKFINEK